MGFASFETAFRFEAGDIRSVLSNKADCLFAGFSSNDTIIETFDEIRNNYLFRVGLPTYLGQMLDELGNVPVQYCTLYKENGHRIELSSSGDTHQSVRQFIIRHFRQEALPFKIEIRSELNPWITKVRYL